MANNKVTFNSINTGRCQCPQCPVQANSTCVAEKLRGLGAALKKDPLIRADIPGQYCATGTATCTDLNPDKTCLCPSCEVFKEYNLDQGTPLGYFCRDGIAK